MRVSVNDRAVSGQGKLLTLSTRGIIGVCLPPVGSGVCGRGFEC